MKRAIIYIATLLLVFVVTLSCGSEASLQKYYIDNQDNKNFTFIDAPASLLQLKGTQTEEEKEAISSIRKFNILAFKKDDTNDAEYKLEKKKIKAILKSARFKELMRIKDKQLNLIIKYEGDEDAKTMDEVIIYASNKDNGFAIIRVLGDKMEPAKIMKLANNLSSMNSEDLKQLENIFKDLK